MASTNQLVMSEVKIEIDIAEEPGPPWGSQHHCSGATCDLSGNSVSSSCETNCWNPSAAIMKCEPDSQPASGEGIKAEPVDHSVTGDMFHQFQSADNREEKMDIKCESSTCADLSSSPLDPWSVVKSEDSKPKVWNNRSEVNFDWQTESTGANIISDEAVTANISSNIVKSDMVTADISNDVKTEAVSTNISDDIKTELLIANTSNDVIKTETATANISSDVQTEAVTDIMMTVTSDAVRSEAFCSRDGEKNRPAGDKQASGPLPTCTPDVVGHTDDEESDFEGFAAEDLVRIDSKDQESDLDIDFDALQAEFSNDSDSESDSEGSSVNLLPPLPGCDWSSQLRQVSDEQFEEDVGVRHQLEVGADPVEYFQLFFSDGIFDFITEETNLYAQQVQSEKGGDSNWRPTTSAEVKVFVAINIMMGIHVLPRMENYWSSDDKLNVPCISSLMSRSRFHKLGQYLHLNDRTKYIPRGQPGFDPLFKVRPLLDHIREQCSSLYMPGQAISIGEAMVKFNGRLGFKQYMKGKPTPWGIKVWCAADPATGYLLNFSVYTGKTEQQMKGGLGYHVVMTVAKDYLGKGYHFFHDSFFTSVQLAEDLLAQKTRCCGTIRMTRKGWPADLNVNQKKGKVKRRLKTGEVKMLQKGDMVATVWQEKRTTSVLSTNVQPVMGSAPRQTSKGQRVEKAIPQPILTFNDNMGGVDLHDQHRSYYPVGRPGRKWWRYLLWFLVQSSLINAFIIFKRSNRPAPRSKKPQDQLHFRLAVFDRLVCGNVFTKRQVQMQPSVTGRAVSDPTEHPMIRMPGRKKNCLQCQRSGRRTPKGQGVQTVWGCPLCKAHLCKGHCFAQFHFDLLH